MIGGRKRLAIFDVDGTLIDSQTHILGAMSHAFGALGLPCPPREAVLAIVGLSLPEAMARLAPGEDGAALVAAYKGAFGSIRAQSASPLYPGAAAALDRLAARGVTLGIATGKSRRGLDHVLAAHGLAGCFATAQVADDHPSKPHPSMILTALQQVGVAAQDAVMIGDTSFDMDMGRAAGVRCIGVSWGYHPLAALAGADARIDSFDALDAALGDIWGQG